MKELIGVWLLDEFTISKDGRNKPWGEDLKGQLIYTTEGYMSVGFTKKSNSDDSDALLDSILFYSGSYRVKEGQILHSVHLASDPNQVGKEMIREFKLTGDRLELRSQPESFGIATVTWTRSS